MKLPLSLSKMLEASHQWIPYCFSVWHYPPWPPRKQSEVVVTPSSQINPFYYSFLPGPSDSSSNILPTQSSVLTSSQPSVKEPYRVIIVGPVPGILASTLKPKSWVNAPMSIYFPLSSFRLYLHLTPPQSNKISAPTNLFRLLSMNISQDKQVFGVSAISS